jgi:hypothetical protein
MASFSSGFSRGFDVANSVTVNPRIGLHKLNRSPVVPLRRVAQPNIVRRTYIQGTAIHPSAYKEDTPDIYAAPSAYQTVTTPTAFLRRVNPPAMKRTNKPPLTQMPTSIYAAPTSSNQPSPSVYEAPNVYSTP